MNTDTVLEQFKLLKCFVRSKSKCHYLCTIKDQNIEALSDLLHEFINEKLKLSDLKAKAKSLYPIRHLIRILADKKVKTKTKRKILLQFGVKLLLFPILEKDLIPCFGKLVKRNAKKNKIK